MDPCDIFPLPASIMLGCVHRKHGETLQGEGMPSLAWCSCPAASPITGRGSIVPPPPTRRVFSIQLLPRLQCPASAAQNLLLHREAAAHTACPAPAEWAALPAASCGSTGGFASIQFLPCMAAGSAPCLAASPSISGHFI